MPRRDVEFKTSDHVILRGWFFTPATSAAKLPCLVMTHGYSAVKEMDLDTFAEHFISNLPIACLVYDNRGFGASDAAKDMPRQELIPQLQMSDISDAITYAQSLSEVDPAKIGIWGSSYSGGNVLYIGAADRRVKAVLSQVPMVNGPENRARLVRADLITVMQGMWEADRKARAEGKEPIRIPVVSNDPAVPCALPTPESWEFFQKWEGKCPWKNEVTLKSGEYLGSNNPSHLIHQISPTPLLLTVAENDTLCPTDLALEAYSRAREPKQLHIIPGGHFEAYSGEIFKVNIAKQVDFLRGTLCKGLQGPGSLPIR